MNEAQLLSLCGNCPSLAIESRYLGVQFASVGPWKLRVVAIDCQGPLRLLGEQPEKATPLGSRPLSLEAERSSRRRPSDKNLTAFFLHGGGGRAGQFRHQIHHLAQRGVRCIAADLPGHGLSILGPQGARGDSAVCSVEQSQVILKATFDSLAATHPAVYEGEKAEKGPRRKAVLVAHSFGCLQALRLYQQLLEENREDEIAAICLIGGNSSQRLPGLSSWLLLHLPKLLLRVVRSFISVFAQRLLFSKESRIHNKRVLQHEAQIASRNPLDIILQVLQQLRSGAAHKHFQSGQNSHGSMV